MQPHGAAMTQRPSHTPPTAPATLGDGCPRLAGSGYGPPRCSLISSAQIRRGCCPPPARMTPAGSDRCNPPRYRGSNLLPLLSGFGRRTVPPNSTSWAPGGAAAHSFARCLHSLASSTVRDEDQHDRSRSNTPDPLVLSALGLDGAEASKSAKFRPCRRPAATCTGRAILKGRPNLAFKELL